MSKALSLDLWVRVLAAVADSASRWRRRDAAQGNPGPRALGGDRRSGRIEQHREQILGALADQPDLTIEELRRALAEHGLRFGFVTLHRFLVRHRMTRKKKTGHAREQDRPDVRQRRQAWAGAQARLDPGLLVFLDETGTKTNMARTHGRAPRSQRLQMSVPHGHWHTSTVVAGLTLRDMIAPRVLDGPMNRAAFGTYVERVLVPERRPGDIVILDNLPSHKGSRVRNLFLPPAPNSCSCRLTAPTTTRSSSPSPSSRPFSTRPLSAPSKPSGTPSDAPSTPSHPPNAATTPRPSATIRRLIGLRSRICDRQHIEAGTRTRLGAPCLLVELEGLQYQFGRQAYLIVRGEASKAKPN